jgi:hypothetical protein
MRTYFAVLSRFKIKVIVFNKMVTIIRTAEANATAPIVSIRAGQSSIFTK